MNIVFFILLALCSIGIAYQDFKERMISLWLIICFGILTMSYCFYAKGFYQVLENALFLGVYLLLSYCILCLYYFLKTKRFEPLMDSKVGWGDVLLVISIGMTMEPAILVSFFTTCFGVAILGRFLFYRSETIPLAGILAISFFAYIFSVAS